MSTAGPDFPQMRLLIAVADIETRESLTDALAQAGHADIVNVDDPISASRHCVSERPDLVVLDLGHDASGQDALVHLQHLTGPPNNLPVIAVVDAGSSEVRSRAVALGVRDFLAKPIEATDLIVRVRNAHQTRQLQQRLDERHPAALGYLQELTSEVDATRESLSVLAAIAEYHDDDTYQHAQRVGVGAALIAEALELPGPFVRMLRDAAPLHDIGKVGMSRRILLKPGKLTPAEWMHMMRHVEIGGRILASARSPVLRLAGDIARTHHERWDGNGYLTGLAGEDIPLAGRITAVADVWDTLTHQRPYRAAWDGDRARAEIMREAGRHFDPRVVDAFGTIDWRRLNLILASELAERAA